MGGKIQKITQGRLKTQKVNIPKTERNEKEKKINSISDIEINFGGENFAKKDWEQGRWNWGEVPKLVKMWGENIWCN